MFEYRWVFEHVGFFVLVGKAKGASVEVNTPGGAKAYEVKKVEWR